MLANADGDPIRIKQINDAYAFMIPKEELGTYSPYRTYGVKDGRIGFDNGGGIMTSDMGILKKMLSITHKECLANHIKV
jgi:hypothetical protein